MTTATGTQIDLFRVSAGSVTGYLRSFLAWSKS